MNTLILSSEQERLKGRFLRVLGRPLLKGNVNLGYFGEFTADEVIHDPTLVSTLGLTAGTAQWNNEKWLGFSYRGRRLLVAKKPKRNFISWNDLNARGLIFGRDLVIKGLPAKCRVLTGGNGNPSTAAGGEYSALIASVSESTNGEFAQFTAAALGMGPTHASENPGRVTICQETGVDPLNRVTRGSSGQGIMAYFNHHAATLANEATGWRPVIEFT